MIIIIIRIYNGGYDLFPPSQPNGISPS